MARSQSTDRLKLLLVKVLRSRRRPPWSPCEGSSDRVKLSVTGQPGRGAGAGGAEGEVDRVRLVEAEVGGEADAGGMDREDGLGEGPGSPSLRRGRGHRR